MQRSELISLLKRKCRLLNKMHIVASLFFCAILYICLLLFSEGYVLVNGHFVAVEKATTTQHWKEGLSGLAKPRRSGGMFFVFDRRIKPVFWMSGMQFAIDAVWVREGVVLQVMANLQPPQPGRPAMEFSPDQPVDAVWELPAGMAEELCIQPGSRIYSMNPFGR